MKKLLCVIKSFSLSFVSLMLFNRMAIGINVYIPINIITVLVVCFFGLYGLVLLIIIVCILF